VAAGDIPKFTAKPVFEEPSPQPSLEFRDGKLVIHHMSRGFQLIELSSAKQNSRHPLHSSPEEASFNSWNTPF